ncbi:VOC family protein [Pseudokineococcus sp. 5B2Z-1]|uniref:VOC family protein n=1 Tax=Pseudokineococcus sp. 5B2Z-1 TaxID=3132744 RepID=UPI0030992DB8
MAGPAWTLTVDCADPGVMATFWKAALGYVDAPPPDGFASWPAWLTAMGVPRAEWDDGAAIVDPSGDRPAVSLLRVPEAKLQKNRWHVDLPVSGGRARSAEDRERLVRAEVVRLGALGARVLAEHRTARGLDHVVMADPEGNEFCVV